MDAKLAYKTYLASELTPVFALEDVYTTGILRNKLDIKEPVTIKNGISICQHLSNAKFHPGITYTRVPFYVRFFGCELCGDF